MKQSFGAAPNLPWNSAFVQSLMCPAPSAESLPRSPENSLPAWPKESWNRLYKNGSHWLFCELRPMHLNVAPFARICTVLNVLPLDAVILPVNCRQIALLAPL